MGAGSDKLGDSMCEGRVGCDVEDWEGVFAVLHAPLRENDSYEVDAGGSEEWK